MPLFFNRIRKKLAKDNKFFQYSRYAVGEILLVVIGILIALQVNNWNEERKLRMKGEEYISNIYREANIEIDRLNDAISLLEEQDHSARYLLNILESMQGVIVDSLEFVQMNLKLVDMVKVDRDKNTWDELSASSSLSILNDKTLEAILLDYYSNYDRIALNFNEVPRSARMKARDIAGNCFDLKSIERSNDTGFKHPPTAQWFSCWKENKETLGTVRNILSTCYWNIQWFNDLKRHAHGVISYLENTYPELSTIE